MGSAGAGEGNLGTRAVIDLVAGQVRSGLRIPLQGDGGGKAGSAHGKRKSTGEGGSAEPSRLGERPFSCCESLFHCGFLPLPAAGKTVFVVASQPVFPGLDAEKPGAVIPVGNSATRLSQGDPMGFPPHPRGWFSIVVYLLFAGMIGRIAWATCISDHWKHGLRLPLLGESRLR